jgi:ribosomal protein L7/L12
MANKSNNSGCGCGTIVFYLIVQILVIFLIFEIVGENGTSGFLAVVSIPAVFYAFWKLFSWGDEFKTTDWTQYKSTGPEAERCPKCTDYFLVEQDDHFRCEYCEENFTVEQLNWKAEDKVGYRNFEGKDKTFNVLWDSVIPKNDRFSVRVGPTFKRISLKRENILPDKMIRYRNFRGEEKEFQALACSMRPSGAHFNVWVAPTFIRIALHKDRILEQGDLTGVARPPVKEKVVEDQPTATKEIVEAKETAELQPVLTTESDPKPEPEPPATQPTTVDIVITDCGAGTYDVTKILGELRPDLGSFDMYGMLRDFPQTIAENVPTEKANEFKKRFEDAGCTVEFHPGSDPAEQPESIEATEPQPEVSVVEEKPVIVAEPEPEPEPVVTESAMMDVVITGCGTSTYDAQKVLEELKPDMRFYDLYKLLRDFPQVACENLPPQEAEANKAKLEAAGCTVELRPHGS